MLLLRKYGTMNFLLDTLLKIIMRRGFVQTPMMEKLDETLGFQLPNDCVLGRRGRPEEIAKLIMFLLSDDSSFTTGSIYGIDGGAVC